MKIIDGQLPVSIEWRVLLVLEAGQEPGIAWQAGSALARANRGDLLVTIFVSPDETETIMAQVLRDATAFRQLLAESNGLDLHVVVVETRHTTMAVSELVKKSSIDLVIMIATRPDQYDFRKIPCTLALLRLAETDRNADQPSDSPSLNRVLIPTSGGPNSTYALALMMMLSPKTETTALYVAINGGGDNEEVLGRERLRQVLDFVRADGKVEAHLIMHDSVGQGIAEEAAKGYDLVVLGATEESRLDRVLFGNIPAAVVENTEKPVMIVRQSNSPIDSMITALDWRLHTIFPKKSIGERAEIYARIRRDARPKTAFFVMIALSSMIAALGLIVNSPAVVIGAMLVAPLMSPIIGTGLAIVLGDTRFLRLAAGAVGRGVFLAILVGMLAGLTALNRPLSDEILARTQPNLFDLGIAIFSGAAAAYALSFSQAAGALPGVAIAAALVPPLATVGITLVAGLAALFGGDIAESGDYLTDSLGALLLFLTNFVAISSATALVFFILGFRPTPSKKARREVQRRSSAMALTSLVIVGLVLGITSLILARESTTENRIYSITETAVVDGLGASLERVDILERTTEFLNLSLTVISPRPIPHSQVVELQQELAEDFATAGIANDFALTISVIRVTELDPLNPPTPTPLPDAVNLVEP